MREHIAPNLLLARLHKVDIREHTLVLERAGQLAGDGGRGVQSREGNELEDESTFISQ